MCSSSSVAGGATNIYYSPLQRGRGKKKALYILIYTVLQQ